MPFRAHFYLADDVFSHLNTYFLTINDPFLKSRYTGFAAITSVTAYEVTFKNILLGFARQKNEIFYNYISSHIQNFNSKIKIDDLKKNYLRKFGDSYATKFSDLLQEKEDLHLSTYRTSLKNVYFNIIEWRHQFAHDGTLPHFVTYNEVIASYEQGKSVIECFYNSLY